MSRLTGNTPPASFAQPRPGMATVVLCGVQFVDVLGVTVVLTALPRMLADLGGTRSQGTVVATAYALSFGGLLMLAARVGDRVGHRRVLLGALLLFAAASLLAAVAGSVWLLAGARAMQGVAAAGSVPAALRLLTTIVPEGPQRRRAVAGWSAAGAGAGASGFVVGGVLTQLATWRVVFWANIVLAAVLATTVLAAVPRDRASASHPRVAWASGALLTVAVMSVVIATTVLEHPGQWPVAFVVAVAAVLALIGFAAVERRTHNPLVPAAAWRASGLRWGAFGSFVNTAATSSSFTVATFYLQDTLGLTPLQAAALLVSFSVLVVAGSTLAPRLLGAFRHRRTLAAGLTVIAAGNVLLAAWPQVLGIGVAAAISGLGLGIASVAATDWSTSVDDTIKGTAGGIVNTTAQLGTALGTAAILLAATTLTPTIAWTLAALLSATAALATARGGRPTARAGHVPTTSGYRTTPGS